MVHCYSKLIPFLLLVSFVGSASVVATNFGGTVLAIVCTWNTYGSGVVANFISVVVASSEETIVHGFWPKSENFDFGKKQNQAIEHLKGSRMAQISAL